jgi:hypothetical protein
MGAAAVRATTVAAVGGREGRHQRQCALDQLKGVGL